MPKLDDNIQNIVSVYEDARSLWATSFDKARKCYEFVMNQQWTDTERQAFIKRGNAPMVYNMILPRLYNLIGTEQLNRRSTVIRPFSQGQQPLADLLNGIFKNNWELKSGEDELIKVFSDGLIMPIPGSLQITVLPDEAGFMDYNYTALNPFSVTYDPKHTDAKLRDCRFVITQRWLRLDEITDTYGNKAGLEMKGYNRKWWQTLSENMANAFSGLFGRDDVEGDWFDKDNETYKVLEMQARYIEKRELFVNTQTGEYFVIKKEDVEMFKAQVPMAFHVGETDVKKIWITTICPYFNVTLLDEPNWLDTDMYDIIPYYSFTFNNIKTENSSLVYALLDPQRNLNKREIQKSSFIDRAMSAPLFFSHEDRDAKEEYEERGNLPNKAILLRNLKFPPFRASPSQMPNDAWNDIADSENKMNDISGINDTARGQSQYSNESGRLFEMKAQRVGATINPYLRSLSQTRKMIGEYFLSTVKQVYSEPNRVVNVSDARHNIYQSVLNLQTGDQTFNDITSFNGRVIIDEGDRSPTKLQENLQTKLAIAQMMNPQLVNWEWVLKDSDLPDVQEQIDYINMMMGLQAQQQAQQQGMMEDQYASQQAAQEQQILLQQQQAAQTQQQQDNKSQAKEKK